MRLSRLLLIGVVASGIGGSPSAQASKAKTSETSRPPLSRTLVFRETVSGALCSVAMAVDIALVGAGLSAVLNGGESSEAFVKVCAFSGAVFGGAMGIYTVGTEGSVTGSYRAAATGYLVGGIVAVSFIEALPQDERMVWAAPAALVPVVCSRLAFNRTRRYASQQAAFAPARDDDPTSIQRRGNARRFAANVAAMQF